VTEVTAAAAPPEGACTVARYSLSNLLWIRPAWGCLCAPPAYDEVAWMSASRSAPGLWRPLPLPLPLLLLLLALACCCLSPSLASAPEAGAFVATAVAWVELKAQGAALARSCGALCKPRRKIAPLCNGSISLFLIRFSLRLSALFEQKRLIAEPLIAV